MGTLEKILGKIKVVKRKLVKKKSEKPAKGTLVKKKIKKLPVSKKKQ